MLTGLTDTIWWKEKMELLVQFINQFNDYAHNELDQFIDWMYKKGEEYEAKKNEQKEIEKVVHEDCKVCEQKK